MKNTLVLVFVLLSGIARAEGIDDAVAAVHEAQRVGDEASCKGLSTKLKLSLEFLEKARKAPVAGVVQQARGRLEVARDHASTACSDAVKAKVTGALASAIAAIEHVGEKKKEKKGAPLNTECKASDECYDEHCYVGGTGSGYCTRECNVAGDCPAGFDCKPLRREGFNLCMRSSKLPAEAPAP